MLRFAIVIVLALVASLASWLILNQTYAYDAFASEEAKTSLEVTEEQTLELSASRRLSDMIAYGLFTGLLGLVCGGMLYGSSHQRNILGGLLAGLFIGIAAGALSGFLAHWHYNTMVLGADALVYWCIRWLLILTPIGLACGIAAKLAAKSKGWDEVVGGVLGGCAAAILYSFFSGSLTTMEHPLEIFPAHSENRILAFALGSVCIAATIYFQQSRAAKNQSQEPAGDMDAS